VASFASQLSLLIGLGVGVDYALFVVTRYRQGLKRGKPIDLAIVDAVDTSGRAVLFAGMTVCIALLGMFALGISFLYGVAIAASIAVLLTVIATLTLLPALLGLFGTHILPRRARRARNGGSVAASDASPRWAQWAQTVRDRPAIIATVATVLLLLLAVPFFSIRLGSADAGTDPPGTTTRTAYDLIAKGFGPGLTGPLVLVAQVDGHDQQAAFSRVVAQVARTADVVGVSRPALVRGTGGAADVISASVYPSGAPQDASTTVLLTTLRDRVIPAASTDGVRVLVGGQTATINDFSAAIAAKLPLFIGAVLGLSFLLLMLVFRSLMIPAIAAFMNLLTAGASFGLITAVFQWGWLDTIFPGATTGPIEPFVPVMMFAIVFGLSMDYQVFLVTRVYEEWHRTGDTRVAVTRGLAATGRTITAAAAIMVLVFAAFILGGNRVIELFGLGLAGAVFLDAVVVRSALVPALMFLGGRANWWMPRALDRVLPHLNVEGDADPAPKAPAVPKTPVTHPVVRPAFSRPSA
jgi:RND superfamily putative drug exporter